MPQEVHEHFSVDPADPERPVLTGYTVVTRESPWNEETRERALALTELEDAKCKCGCGRPAAETLRKDQAYMVHNVRCAAGRALDEIKRKDRERHKDDPAWEDGRHWYAEPVDLPQKDPDPDL